MSITGQQITREIEGKVVVNIHFTDISPETVSLYHQEDKFFIRPVFGKVKEISAEIYNELISKFTGEQEFCTHPEVIRCQMTYDDFFNKYFNNF